MINRDLKRLLASSLEKEEALIEFIEGCLDVIFEPIGCALIAKHRFNEDSSFGFDNNGYIQPVNLMIEDLAREKIEGEKKEDSKLEKNK